MNKERRKRLRKVVWILESKKLNEALTELEDILSDEEYAFDSMPENLQYSMRGEESQECIDTMESAIDDLNEIINGGDSDLEDIINDLSMISF